MSDKYGLDDIPAFRRKKIASEMWDQVQSGAKNLQKGDSQSSSVGNFQTKGKQQLLEGQTTRTKGMGAGLLKSIKNKMMKHLPGKLKKTY